MPTHNLRCPAKSVDTQNLLLLSTFIITQTHFGEELSPKLVRRVLAPHIIGFYFAINVTSGGTIVPADWPSNSEKPDLGIR